MMNGFLLDHDFSTHVWDYDKINSNDYDPNIVRESELMLFCEELMRVVMISLEKWLFCFSNSCNKSS